VETKYLAGFEKQTTTTRCLPSRAFRETDSIYCKFSDTHDAGLSITLLQLVNMNDEWFGRLSVHWFDHSHNQVSE